MSTFKIILAEPKRLGYFLHSKSVNNQQRQKVKSETTIGYVMQFSGHGAFSPDGKVEMTHEQSEAHNHKLMVAELEAMKQTGRALLYLFKDETGSLSVGQWSSEPFQRTPVWRARHSHNNWGAQRTDVWFNADGSTWHGVNLGDNDIVRCKRIKST